MRIIFPTGYLLNYWVGGETLLPGSFLDSEDKRTIFPHAFSAKEPFTLFAVLLRHYSPIIINLPERKSMGKAWITFLC